MVLPFAVGTLGVVVLMPLSSAMDDGEFNRGCGLRCSMVVEGGAFNGGGSV
jgi:hypothetical protein